MITEQTLEHPFIKQLVAGSIFGSSTEAEALENIHNTAVPTTKTEAWKYTRLAKLTSKSYQQSTGKSELTSQYIVDEDAIQFVFVNGFLNSELSFNGSIDGLIYKSITDCSEEELAKAGGNIPLTKELFNAVNTIYSTDGIYLEIEKNATIEKCIQITHISTGQTIISNQRNIIIANQSSEAKIIQAYFSENANDTFVNHISEFFVGKNANLLIDKIQYEEESCNQIITEQVEQQDDSTFTINTVTLNGGLVRNNLNIAVNGQNCETNLNAVYLLNGNQHVDNHTIVDHLQPNCNSNELYKGVIDGKATAVFNGKVFVRKDAQKINAFQSNGNVLLTDDASVNSKPELEIYADDVKCSHGSTTGQLDEEAVFYLRARGLSEKAARQLMVGAFVGEVFEKIENESVMSFIQNILSERFGWINE